MLFSQRIEIVDGQNDIRCFNPPGSYPVRSVAPGLYYLHELMEAINTALDFVSMSWRVNEVSGRLEWMFASKTEVRWADPLTTFPLEFVGSDGTNVLFNASVFNEYPYTTRGTWFSPHPPLEFITSRIRQVAMTYYPETKRTAGHAWGDENGALTLHSHFDMIPAPLARIDAAWMAPDFGWDADDQNISWERFCLMFANDPATAKFIIYQGLPATTGVNYIGPFTFPEVSGLFEDALATADPRHSAGEYWSIGIPAVEVAP